MEENIEKKSRSITWADPITVFKPDPDPKNIPLGTQKVKNDPKIMSRSKVRIERTIENKSCSTTWVGPKTVFEPYPDPKNRPLGPSLALAHSAELKSKNLASLSPAQDAIL